MMCLPAELFLLILMFEKLEPRARSIPKFVMMEQSGKLIRWPEDFPKQGKSVHFSARFLLLLGTTPAHASG
jgi:hypothetical protein